MLDTITKLISGSKSIAVNVADLLMAVAFIAFLLTVINYIWKRNTGNGEGLKQAGNMLFAAVFALFVMVAVWGLTNFLSNNLGIGIGGCTSRPSPIPGQPSISDCDSTSAANTNSAASARNGARTSCPSGSVLVAGYCEARTGDINPPPISTAGSASADACANGIRRQARNGDVLSCNKGIQGEACESGTCNSGFSCDLSSNNSYGTCRSI
jgi:hypothetical protein